jgi:RNA polymerase sigma-70 factor (ECF subfamily)
LLALLGNKAEAEDALQAVFVELARKPEILGRLDSPAAYLFTAARNKALRERKRASRRREAESEAVGPQVLESRDHGRHEPAEVERLERALRTLPDEQREVLALKLFEDMTFAEIGASLGISPNTVAGRYRYALEKLRRVLAP